MSEGEAGCGVAPAPHRVLWKAAEDDAIKQWRITNGFDEPDERKNAA